MKKIYGMRNTKECVLKLQRGKATVVCPFTKGNLQSREPIPATYTTENEVIQGVIETSEMFLGGKIYIVAEYPGASSNKREVVEPAPVVESKPESKKAKAKPKKETRVNENVKTFGDAVTALMVESGVVASDLTDLESVVRKATELGISFPNLKA